MLSQLLSNGHQLSALLFLALTCIIGTIAQQQDALQSTSIANNWNKRMLMFNSDAFRNRRGWANRDVEISNNVEVEGGQPQQPRSIRRSPASSQGTHSRSRSCYFTPIQCSLYQQKFNNVASEGGDLSVIRPLMNSDHSRPHTNQANSRKRQIARQNALLIQRWRSASDSSRLRL